MRPEPSRQRQSFCLCLQSQKTHRSLPDFTSFILPAKLHGTWVETPNWTPATTLHALHVQSPKGFCHKVIAATAAYARQNPRSQRPRDGPSYPAQAFASVSENPPSARQNGPRDHGCADARSPSSPASASSPEHQVRSGSQLSSQTYPRTTISSNLGHESTRRMLCCFYPWGLNKRVALPHAPALVTRFVTGTIRLPPFQRFSTHEDQCAPFMAQRSSHRSCAIASGLVARHRPARHRACLPRDLRHPFATARLNSKIDAPTACASRQRVNSPCACIQRNAICPLPHGLIYISLIFSVHGP